MSAQRVITVRDIARTLDLTQQRVHAIINSGALIAKQTDDREYRPPYTIQASDFDAYLKARVAKLRNKASELEGCIGKAGK
jgi:hypothetical protein